MKRVNCDCVRISQEHAASLEPSDSQKYKILSIDGGGLKGLTAAVMLMDLEKKMGKPLRECFDFFIGTSTGGIISLALAYGLETSKIRDIYELQGDEIFYKNDLPRKLKIKYSAKGLLMLATELFCKCEYCKDKDTIKGKCVRCNCREDPEFGSILCKN